jgi:eukaryotic-like serine/threonine-protein kinase
MTIVNTSGVVRLLGSDWSPPAEFDEFRIVRLLGSGASGDVYLAQDLLLERNVAVKFVRGADSPGPRARVIEEARAIARLQHPNVVAVHRVADLAGHPYLVSEYVEGQSLQHVERPMPWRHVLDIALDVARGLAAAHRRGVLHRDVKPANVVLTREGRAKLLDFGLATITDDGTFDSRPAAPAQAPEPGATPAPVPTGEDAALVNGTGPYMAGTPLYMAPEIWRAEPATRQSDLYSLGIVVYELLTGKAPFRDVGIMALRAAVQEAEIPRVTEAAPEVDPALARVVDQLIARDPADRLVSADALIVALEECAAPSGNGAYADDNPYRGLAVFEAEHAPLFFGRRSEIRELAERVRAEPLVVVGGDSGTGKSSLCRAGVLPWLANHDGWSCVEVVPGRHPVRALAAALAPWTSSDEAALADLLRDSPDAVAREIRRRIVAEARPPTASPAPPRRLLLFVDQLEELLTLALPEEAAVIATAIAGLAVRSPSLRVLATARSDFLSRLATLPGLGDELARGLYFLRPLSAEHIREVIVRPAAARGVAYESEAVVEALVAQTDHAPGGLPLLQFTLAELWEVRDAGSRTIRGVSLAAMGGVAGALTRHADRVVDGLTPGEREAARRILLRLVTTEGTRTRATEAELLTGGPEADAQRAALEALVRGRVLVASNAQDGGYEVAHEALLSSWSTLQDWLQRDAVNQAVRERVAHAAVSWERMGRPGELLWGRRQLAETRALDLAVMPARDAAFLAAAGRAVRRRRLLAVGLISALVVGVVVVGAEIRARARQELESIAEAQAAAAQSAQASARATAQQRDAARKRAIDLFDSGHWSEGETAWTEVEAMRVREEQQYRSASQHLDSILLIDPRRTGLRAWAFDLALERLLRAERDHRRDLAIEMASRLSTFGDHRERDERHTDAILQLAVSPAATRVWLERGDVPGAPVEVRPPVITLPPTAVVLVFRAPGHVTARLPLLGAHGETRSLRVALPALDSAPPGMLYVPAGPFLFGGDDASEASRQLLNTVPLHELSTGAYYIGQYEVTFGEWIAYLDELPADERRRRTPRSIAVPSSDKLASSVELTELGPRRWRLRLKPTTETYTAETGQPLRYAHRTRRAEQDWTRFPVSGVTFADASAFAAWLDRTGRVPGARLCDEYEWERAARGADARTFPSGAKLAPDDANIDVTYGRDPLAFGPDEVGAHPGSRSPIGADDMAGNVWEITRSARSPGMPVIRGGSWYQGDLSAQSQNREDGEVTQRSTTLGLRLCATPR